MTQPRRIAAISIAKRVSEERHWPVGTLVGYQVGMVNNTSPDTRLTYCTTGVLLQKLINTKHLMDYTHIILDEVHERDQDMDFLLLVVRKLSRMNSHTVRIVLMSATFDVDKFSKYFSLPVGKTLAPAPVIDIDKNTFFRVNKLYLNQLRELEPVGFLRPIPQLIFAHSTFFFFTASSPGRGCAGGDGHDDETVPKTDKETRQDRPTRMHECKETVQPKRYSRIPAWYIRDRGDVQHPEYTR